MYVCKLSRWVVGNIIDCIMVIYNLYIRIPETLCIVSSIFIGKVSKYIHTLIVLGKA